MGIIIAMISGMLMSIQGVFNTNVTKKIGLWETNLIVQGIALITTVVIYFIFRKGNWSEIGNVGKLYFTGGIIGTFITATVVVAMKALSPSCAVSVILISQLISAAAIDYFGWFGIERMAFGLNKFIGVLLLVIGVIVFKYK
ncbi:transporter family-2 protein [Hathewaya proteolytica DSM 3090]|uniref:Transporter family-2 protein n=1 Tax=Hathewaya proteolytica DSM 3090 TaxID=1121331 RepID=A0A1M6MT62_9CLOT|nr:DMT family transporter [Hathewaya proteolytica]SHJ86671.1 transporter family-2 protein [Hathewaya proteolytica DSM 3090]